MKHYVLGFVFNYTLNKVLLIRKERPAWQYGYWNGIGGKIKEIDNSPLEAMNRESKEEIGMRLNWEHCITFVCSGGTILVYKAIDHLNCGYEEYCNEIHFKQIEDEKLAVWRLDSLPDKKDRELDWIIPVLLSAIQFPITVCLRDVERHMVKSNNQKCRLCNGTGKPCNSCGEYHPSITMCPPHEVRMKWAKNICPDCGRKETKVENENQT